MSFARLLRPTLIAALGLFFASLSSAQCGAQCPNCCSGCCGSICLDGVTCPCPNETPHCINATQGCFPACDYSCTPIVLDPFDDGFHLTGFSEGVKFRVAPNGPLLQMSWTDPRWRDGWLVLDRNGNGTIDDLTELFGNMTPQPSGASPNGFRALAVFDDPANGGNGSGFIDPGDSVYTHLRVWIDGNHDGVSEPEELHTLQDVGIFRISLHYTPLQHKDPEGNTFRYRAKVWDATDQGHDTCYDVFLQVEALQSPEM